jgi:hypothetical protein
MNALKTTIYPNVNKKFCIFFHFSLFLFLYYEENNGYKNKLDCYKHFVTSPGKVKLLSKLLFSNFATGYWIEQHWVVLILCRLKHPRKDILRVETRFKILYTFGKTFRPFRLPKGTFIFSSQQSLYKTSFYCPGNDTMVFLKLVCNSFRSKLSFKCHSAVTFVCFDVWRISVYYHRWELRKLIPAGIDVKLEK